MKMGNSLFRSWSFWVAVVCVLIAGLSVVWAVVGTQHSSRPRNAVAWRSLSAAEIQRLKIDSPRMIRPSDMRSSVNVNPGNAPGVIDEEYLAKVDDHIYGKWLEFDIFNGNDTEVWNMVIDLKCQMPNGEWRTYGAVGTARMLAPPQSWSRATVELIGIPDKFQRWTPVISSASTIR